MNGRLFHRFALAALLAAPCGASACASATPIPMVGSPQTPAAQGAVTAEVGANGNTRLVVDVKHLAPPERVSPAAKVYVVWVQPRGSAPQNVGALHVDQNLSGRLETVTAHTSFEVSVTAEEFPATTSPRGPRVLHAVIAQ